MEMKMEIYRYPMLIGPMRKM